MAEAGNVQAGDLVVEIGPGKGALTRVLLETGAKVLAFEKDHRLIELLKTEFAEYAQKGLFELHEQDVLVGTNWNADLHGHDSEAAELARELADALQARGR